MAIKPMINPPSRGKQVAAGSGIAALLASAVALIGPWEGMKNDPYRDIVGVWTVCYGETRVEMKSYSTAECKSMLSNAIARDYLPPIQKCVPGLKDPTRINQAVASVSLAYNIGTGGFCKSSVARAFNAGDWKGGCNAFMRWNMAGGKVIKGLTNRRAAEREICLRDA